MLEIINTVEENHKVQLTCGLAKCIEDNAAAASDVEGFGQTLKNGYRHPTVFIRDGDTTRELFFDPETWKVEEVI